MRGHPRPGVARRLEPPRAQHHNSHRDRYTMVPCRSPDADGFHRAVLALDHVIRGHVYGHEVHASHMREVPRAR